jgi:hypothetical protein
MKYYDDSDNLRRVELRGNKSITLHCCAYPRPGAVWSHLVMNHIKELQIKNRTKTIESKDLISFYPWLIGGSE